jgi:MFS family permease
MVSAKFGARAMSLTSFFGWIGMGFGGFLGGYFFDIYGDYNWAFAFSGITGIVNLFILTLFFVNIRKRENLLLTS